jgi:hypothetical protein
MKRYKIKIEPMFSRNSLKWCISGLTKIIRVEVLASTDRDPSLGFEKPSKLILNDF